MAVPIDLQERLDTFIEESECPGAALGVLESGEVHAFGSGVLSLRTGLAVTPDSLFQIGSATKVWTATLILRLVDQGSLALDDPVRKHLADFRVADPDVTDQVTLRHLLSHTSGIEGDLFDDTGLNDDAVAKYVALLAEQGSVHAPDETWSYCNSGFVVLGRVIEVLNGTTWEAAIQEQLAGPLGMSAVCTSSAQAIVHRVAVGHVKHPKTGELVVAPQWDLPRAVGPAGTITTSAPDLLKFAQMHLDGGAFDGGRVLSEESAIAMREPQADCPEKWLLADSWGLGWFINHWEGGTAVGHGGNTVGQSTYFHVIPEAGVAVALLTNVTGAMEEADRLLDSVLRDVAGVTKQRWPAPPDEPVHVDPTPYIGTYERLGVRTEVAHGEGGFTMTTTMGGSLAAMFGASEPVIQEMVPMEAGLFLSRGGMLGDTWMPVSIYGGEGDRRRFLHTGARVARRVA